MSLTEISVRVAIVTALALVALIAVGWRRGAPQYPRRPQRSEARRSSAQPSHDEHASSGDTSNAGLHDSIRVGKVATRKVFDVLGLGSIAAFVGILTALVTSIVIASLVTALLNRL